MDVNIDKCGHQELAVKPVHDATMARDHVTKILDLECTLETGGKESSKRSNDRSKERHEEAVDEEGIEGEGFFHEKNPAPCGDGLWESILLGSEQSGWFTAHGHSLQLCAVNNWTDEIGNLKRIKQY